ncbi:beta-mannosidase [Zunongwangia sp. SCSIO 43204]|uniref:glycoside hydrolase family 26 protein n=1 Tax=Zunongwangia sp. SCSIO 43204 TaxID=2779359 RepID=UPI001CA89A04|nr:glycosyl hydrolase [Zunongwangia sp. SCSIO 43204]UAB85027.1 beta-mannosidase [Zunongwangia sp. SCSIO 43204]
MKKIFISVILILLYLSVISCGSSSNLDLSNINTANEKATIGTKILYKKIEEISKQGIAFGHEDATAYGVGWKDDGGKIQSDVEKVTGKFPAVHGFDVGHIELGRSHNLDTVSFELMKNHIKKIHKEGGMITISWHLNNPLSGGSSWDSIPAVASILEGGNQRKKYELWIGRLSSFLKSLQDEKGDYIPIVFRPFHEMNGSWFWWGGENTTPKSYKQLWKETYSLLKKKKVNNLLFAFSPNTLSSKEEFDTYYPGDDFVDIIGVDVYNHDGDEAFTKSLISNIEILKNKARNSNKPYALTETGNTKFGENPKWWTEALYPGIQGTGISWVLVWRNARPNHFFASFKEDVAKEDFKDFEELKEILFLPEVKKIDY